MSSATVLGLPRLVDSLRFRKLRVARWTLIIIGLLLVCVSVGLFIFAEHVVERELQKQHIHVQPHEKGQMVLLERVFLAAQAAVGLLLIILGLFIYQAPMFCSIAALCVYAIHWGVCIVLDPTSLFRGLLIRVLVIAALANAIQAAVRYKRSSVGSLGPNVSAG